jgi:hypothetical protein
MARVPPPAVIKFADTLRSGLSTLRRKMIPPRFVALDFVGELWGFQVTYALTELGAFDQLVSGAQDAATVARAVKADEDMTYRLLRAATTLDLVTEQAGRRFALTAAGRALTGADPESFRDFILFMGRHGWRFWGRLAEAVRTGKSGVEVETGKRLFDFLQHDPAAGALFNRAMTGASNLLVEPVIAAYDFSATRKVVDVGGGHGRLLAAILGAAPNARGVLYDQNSVIEGADALLKQFGVRERVDLVGGSFFDRVPEGGDVYILKAIVHDWQDGDATKILRNVRRAIVPEGRLLLCETVVPPANSKHFAKMLDIEMLVHPGGRERTAEEYARLLDAAGFRFTRVVPTASPASLVEAVPAG